MVYPHLARTYLSRYAFLCLSEIDELGYCRPLRRGIAGHAVSANRSRRLAQD